ncbi:MAG: hypothetical protein ACTSQI_17465 [Candidatus Helarchaeota archaeon]
MSKKILLYSIFDDEFGPMPAFYLPANVDEELIMNIAVQSLTSSFFGDYQKDHQGKAIIALSLADLSMFIYYFVIPSSQARGGTRPGAISILVDKAEEKLLYDNSEYLETRIKQIIPALRSEDPSVSTVELMRLFQDIKKIDPQFKRPAETLDIRSITKMIKKENLARILHCMICNIPLIIVSKDIKSAMLICNSLTPLIPHKIIVLEPLISEVTAIPAFDILIIDEEKWKKDTKIFESIQDIPIYLMDRGKFQNLEADIIFAETLLKKTKKMKSENEVLTFIRISILKMVKKSEQLEDMLEKAENRIDLEVVLEKLGVKKKYLETLFLLLGEKRVELQKKIETKEDRLKKFLNSD